MPQATKASLDALANNESSNAPKPTTPNKNNHDAMTVGASKPLPSVDALQVQEDKEKSIPPTPVVKDPTPELPSKHEPSSSSSRSLPSTPPNEEDPRAADLFATLFIATESIGDLDESAGKFNVEENDLLKELVGNAQDKHGAMLELLLTSRALLLLPLEPTSTTTWSLNSLQLHILLPNSHYPTQLVSITGARYAFIPHLKHLVIMGPYQGIIDEESDEYEHEFSFGRDVSLGREISLGKDVSVTRSVSARNYLSRSRRPSTNKWTVWDTVDVATMTSEMDSLPGVKVFGIHKVAVWSDKNGILSVAKQDLEVNTPEHSNNDEKEHIGSMWVVTISRAITDQDMVSSPISPMTFNFARRNSDVRRNSESQRRPSEPFMGRRNSEPLHPITEGPQILPRTTSLRSRRASTTSSIAPVSPDVSVVQSVSNVVTESRTNTEGKTFSLSNLFAFGGTTPDPKLVDPPTSIANDPIWKAFKVIVTTEMKEHVNYINGFLLTLRTPPASAQYVAHLVAIRTKLYSLYVAQHPSPQNLHLFLSGLDLYLCSSLYSLLTPFPDESELDTRLTQRITILGLIKDQICQILSIPRDEFSKEVFMDAKLCLLELCSDCLPSPRQKLDRVVRLHRCIQKLVRTDPTSKAHHSISTDMILPLLIYVIIDSNVNGLYASLWYTWRLLGQDYEDDVHVEAEYELDDDQKENEEKSKEEEDQPKQKTKSNAKGLYSGLKMTGLELWCTTNMFAAVTFIANYDPFSGSNIVSPVSSAQSSPTDTSMRAPTDTSALSGPAPSALAAATALLATASSTARSHDSVGSSISTQSRLHTLFHSVPAFSMAMPTGGSEYVHTSHQLGSPNSPGILNKISDTVVDVTGVVTDVVTGVVTAPIRLARFVGGVGNASSNMVPDKEESYKGNYH